MAYSANREKLIAERRHRLAVIDEIDLKLPIAETEFRNSLHAFETMKGGTRIQGDGRE